MKSISFVEFFEKLWELKQLDEYRADQLASNEVALFLQCVWEQNATKSKDTDRRTFLTTYSKSDKLRSLLHSVKVRIRVRLFPVDESLQRALLDAMQCGLPVRALEYSMRGGAAFLVQLLENSSSVEHVFVSEQDHRRAPFHSKEPLTDVIKAFENLPRHAALRVQRVRSEEESNALHQLCRFSTTLQQLVITEGNMHCTEDQENMHSSAMQRTRMNMNVQQTCVVCRKMRHGFHSVDGDGKEQDRVLRETGALLQAMHFHSQHQRDD
jgi:hypothetical protein